MALESGKIANSVPVNQKPKCVVFRVDASLEIGTGHVMRCLTLAAALRDYLGAQCYFLSREHPGHLIERIEARGFGVRRLLAATQGKGQYLSAGALEPSHADWLGVNWETDAIESVNYLKQLSPDWLVLDHYALDARWETATCPAGTRLLVIDDLADRDHVADILLDQNLGRHTADYTKRIPACCRLLIGPEYALLRPEFAEWRQASLERRDMQPNLEHLLVSLGGVDQNNVTGTVLRALSGADLPRKCRITVVMGAMAPWVDDILWLAKTLVQPTEVVTDVTDMAKYMAEADLAIGAAGSTSWERCCLGLPTLMLVIADNQLGIATALEQHGASCTLDQGKPDLSIGSTLASLINDQALSRMSQCARELTNGRGAERLIAAMTETV